MQREELDNLIAKHNEEFAALQREIIESKNNNPQLRELEQENEDLQKKLNSWRDEKDKLSRGLESDSGGVGMDNGGKSVSRQLDNQRRGPDAKEESPQHQNQYWGIGLAVFVGVLMATAMVARS
ncbi:hypothetical protein BDP27DRAFT_1372672 [Rhodocollybia butyracea]|uniref:Uncharacterized protein n=1 Tax=Rhodocollybia butyracea TaxID=206335 RepID=A0A9P5P526_9AGAR|nr:hypothetical protein BDP27DRAFT_1372672 [Rhodocollybia butyracea]